METNQTTMNSKHTIPMRTIALREDLLKEENKIISSFDFFQIGELAKTAQSLCERYRDEEKKGFYQQGLTEVKTVVIAIRRLLEETEEWTAKLLSDIDTIKKANLP
jgi:hypothetical protein